jgi:hypothetical protein
VTGIRSISPSLLLCITTPQYMVTDSRSDTDTPLPMPRVDLANVCRRSFLLEDSYMSTLPVLLCISPEIKDRSRDNALHMPHQVDELTQGWVRALATQGREHGIKLLPYQTFFHWYRCSSFDKHRVLESQVLWIPSSLWLALQNNRSEKLAHSCFGP